MYSKQDIDLIQLLTTDYHIRQEKFVEDMKLFLNSNNKIKKEEQNTGALLLDMLYGFGEITEEIDNLERFLDKLSYDFDLIDEVREYANKDRDYYMLLKILKETNIDIKLFKDILALISITTVDDNKIREELSNENGFLKIEKAQDNNNLICTIDLRNNLIDLSLHKVLDSLNKYNFIGVFDCDFDFPVYYALFRIKVSDLFEIIVYLPEKIKK